MRADAQTIGRHDTRPIRDSSSVAAPPRRFAVWVRDCLIGIVGALVGGFLSNLVGKPGGPRLDLYCLLVTAVGATVFMIRLPRAVSPETVS